MVCLCLLFCTRECGVTILQYSPFCSYPQDKMADADREQQPPRAAPERIHPFNAHQEPSISRLELNVPPQRLLCAQQFFSNLLDNPFVGLHQLKDCSGRNKVLGLRVARISASKNVLSQTRGTNGKDNKQNVRTVNYSCLFTLVDPTAPEGDNACFVLFGQGHGAQIFGMDDLSKSDGRIR